jgi:hypothetical protein
MIVKLQCYAGRKADERPVGFQIGDRDFIVEQIVGQWYGPDDSFYKVRAHDGKTYLLQHHGSDVTWSIELSRDLGEIATDRGYPASA